MMRRDLALERSELKAYTRKEVELNAGRYAFAARYATAGRILDVACGTGYGSTMLSGISSLCVGVDVNVTALEQSVASSTGAKTGFVRADGCRLPFPDASFDLVVSMETIEHLEEPETFLQELARTAGTEARVVVSTPNREYKAPWARKLNPYHVREWSPGEFRALVGRHFNDVEMYYQWPSLLQRVKDNMTWTVARLLVLFPSSVQPGVFGLARRIKRLLIRPASTPEPQVQGGLYDPQPASKRNVAGLRRPQTIIVVARNPGNGRRDSELQHS